MKFDWNRVSVAFIAIGTVLIIVAVALFALVATDLIGNTDYSSDLETTVGFGAPIYTPTPGPTPTPTGQFPPGSSAAIERLVIPAVKIDAPVVTKGIDKAGVMQSPDNGFDTAWYEFSAHPGFGGNAVFSGHVDYIKIGKAVFWGLKDLNEGDVIEVYLVDGTVYRYAVNHKQQYDAATAPVDLIVGPTSVETVTLITCGGTFNRTTHQYDKRLIVRAERISEAEPVAPST